MNGDHPEDAEASNEEESVGDENETMPQSARDLNQNARSGSSANTGRLLIINKMFYLVPFCASTTQERRFNY